MCLEGETKEVKVRGKSITVDRCMGADVAALQENGITTLGCCCGHGRYPRTIVCRDPEGAYEYFSGIRLGQKTRNFYRRDSGGHFYLPERCR
jgi:hypothetical protein